MTDFITPTKERPIFKALNTYFGYIETGVYKDWEINDGTNYIGGRTFALSFADAVNRLHDWIKENQWALDSQYKASFEIYVFYGDLDKYGSPVDQKVYSISASKAKKFLL